MGVPVLVANSVAEERLARARAAMGLAGHEVSDPVLVELLRGFAQGEISREELFVRGDERIEAMVR